MKRSFVWRHFSSVDGNTAKCNLCNKRLTLSGGSTSGLKTHLKNQHQIDENSAEMPSRKQPKIDQNATKIPVISFLYYFFSLIDLTKNRLSW